MLATFSSHKSQAIQVNLIKFHIITTFLMRYHTAYCVPYISPARNMLYGWREEIKTIPMKVNKTKWNYFFSMLYSCIYLNWFSYTKVKCTPICGKHNIEFNLFSYYFGVDEILNTVKLLCRVAEITRRPRTNINFPAMTMAGFSVRYCV